MWYLLMRKAPMSSRAIHVVPLAKVNHPHRWAVKRGGDLENFSTHLTQKEAVASGRLLAQEDEVEFVVHGRDGRIRRKDSFGNDPNPPKG